MKVDFKLDDLKSMTALNEIGNSEEVAELIMYLAGDKANGITGTTMVIDHGFLLKN